MKRIASFFLAFSLLITAGATFAKAPPQKTQVPGYYRMNLGKFEITALYDGDIRVNTALLKNAKERDIQSLLAREFVTGPNVQTAVNAYLINTGEQLVLIDTGAAKKFGPTMGYILDGLKAAGYTPEQVDMVLLTHLHGDHVNGLVDAEGHAVFTNAQVWSDEAERYWLDERIAAQAPEAMQALFKMTRDATAPYRANKQWQTYMQNQAIIPGISSYSAHGHTPGHNAYLIESEGQRLLILGDLVHNHAVQFARPNVAIEFDSDKKAAVTTRKAIFAWAAKEKVFIAGMHLPFPGIGHVGKTRDGYRFVPIEFAPLAP